LWRGPPSREAPSCDGKTRRDNLLAEASLDGSERSSRRGTTRLASLDAYAPRHTQLLAVAVDADDDDFGYEPPQVPEERVTQLQSTQLDSSRWTLNNPRINSVTRGSAFGALTGCDAEEAAATQVDVVDAPLPRAAALTKRRALNMARNPVTRSSALGALTGCEASEASAALVDVYGAPLARAAAPKKRWMVNTPRVNPITRGSAFGALTGCEAEEAAAAQVDIVDAPSPRAAGHTPRSSAWRAPALLGGDGDDADDGNERAPRASIGSRLGLRSNSGRIRTRRSSITNEGQY
jgi:hypothetical protein